jgi:WD40-like Beta Propeller Repeat
VRAVPGDDHSFVLRFTLSSPVREKPRVMRADVLSVLVAAVLTVGGLVGGTAAAAHVAKPMFRDAIAPSWSPDGKEIAFAYTWSVKVKNCCGLPPSFQLRRYRVVRTSNGPGGLVHTVLAASGSCCLLMAWAAGGRILLNPNLGLETVGAKGGKPKRLVFSSCAGTPPPPLNCGTLGFILSPNREYAAVPVSSDAADPHVAPGIGLVRLEPGRPAAVLPTPLDAEEGKGGIYDIPLWFSPDSKQLVFLRTSWDGWTPGPPALLAIPIGGSEPVPLAQSGIPDASLLSAARQVQWSHDGHWVAFVEGEDLKVLPTTGEAAPLTLTCGNNTGSNTWEFSWSPTSQRLAYDCAGYYAKKWTYRFMTIGPEGTNPRDLLTNHPLGGGIFRMQWSPDGSRLLFQARRISHRPFGVWTIRPDGHDLTRIG